MSFVQRSFEDIVADVLTNLTQGVSQEVHRISYDPNARPVQIPDVVLVDRPVRRVSLVRGFVQPADPEAEPVRRTFTLNDYELVPNPEDPQNLNTIRFLPFGAKPAPDTDLFVNYYPRNTEPAPVTDMNVGSVARTLVEAMSRELAGLYQQLNLAYESAFLDTAEAKSLDRVAALLAQRRFRAGRPVGKVRFSRRPGSVGSITIPAGTAVSDGQDTLRYETVDSHQMLPRESIAEVRARGARADTPVVEANVLTVVQRAVAGIDSVTNPKPTSRASEDEPDDDFRRRVRGALLGANKGTVAAIENGLLLHPEVRRVKIEEFPNGVAGEIRVDVSLAEGGAALPKSVQDRIVELRPAGIRIVSGIADGVSLAVKVDLALAGSHLPAVEVEEVRRGARKIILERVKRVGVGKRVRIGPIVAALLADDRIVDAQLSIGEKNKPTPAAGRDFDPPASAAVELQETDISFGPETFEEKLSTAAETQAEVRATFKLAIEAGTTPLAAQTEIEDRLRALLGSLTAGAAVDLNSILNAVRNDALYAVDPLGTIITITAGEQFVQIAQGTSAFTVGENQTFSLAAVEVAQ